MDRPPSGAAIVAATGVFTWKPTIAGSYTFKVRVTDNGSPVKYDEEQITVTVTAAFAARKSNELEMEITSPFNASIYPNPGSNKLTVTLNTAMDRIAVHIINENGLTFKKGETILNGKRVFDIDISQLKPSIYFVNLQTASGNKTLKFLKL